MKWGIKVSDLYLIDKGRLSMGLFNLGILIAFLGSLNPWFMWRLGYLYPIPSALCVGSAYVLSRSVSKPLFTRGDFLLPMLAFFLYFFYERMSLSMSVNGYLIGLFRGMVFLALFRLSYEGMQKMISFLAKSLAVLLSASLFGFFLYLSGFPLPSTNAEFGEFYSYSNYYLFMLDDRAMFQIVPRFHSVFIEPSHIGAACAFLLFAQRGQWRRWYNLVLLTTLFLSFSLASYIYLVVIIFLNLWIRGKQIVRKLLVVLAAIGVAVVVTFTYNNGDNLVHNLILLRMEIDDGEMAGDNRVSSNFEADYETFLSSGDVLLGREMDTSEFGNAGYRVFFYEHGIVGIVLVWLFYVVSLMYTPNKRAFVSVLFVAFLFFGVSAFMLWDNIFIPLYAAAYLTQETLPTPKQEAEQPAQT